ncbi:MULTISPECIES: hypothetical protein [Mycobacterium]|uniref:hypothetical protein n=1 Tax=Mycobacterium TaxID=1763 RepID=UPI000BB079A7|nr:hypothetical protein [Mycobacterium avium]PBA03602.1 hypothetical protein CKJ73_24540 [Mycobacterium avium]
MTSTYVATVSPFGGSAPGDGAALARVRYVNDHATYVAVTDVSHEALPDVTGYPLEFWLTIDQLARQAHHYLAELVATGKLARVSTFQELPPTVAGRIHDSLGLARLGPVEQVYVQLRVTDLLRFGCPPARKCPPTSR